MDAAIAEIRSIQRKARTAGNMAPPRWPMIILRTPKGWTGPKTVDGKQTEGSWRSHQVPFGDMAGKTERVPPLGKWGKGCRPGGGFDGGARPHANGGILLRSLEMPDYREYAVDVPKPGGVTAEATRVMGRMLRDVMKRNAEARNFRVMGPDETASNRLDALFEATDRTWVAATAPGDDHLSPGGRGREILSEHTRQGGR